MWWMGDRPVPSYCTIRQSFAEKIQYVLKQGQLVLHMHTAAVGSTGPATCSGRYIQRCTVPPTKCVKHLQCSATNESLSS
jgi:hypothetical protein